jgi:hypothetical protein
MTTMIPEQIQAIPIEKRTWRQHDRMALHLANLDEAELLYRQGRVSEDDMIDYCGAGTRTALHAGRVLRRPHSQLRPHASAATRRRSKKYGVRR